MIEKLHPNVQIYMYNNGIEFIPLFYHYQMNKNSYFVDKCLGNKLPENIISSYPHNYFIDLVFNFNVLSILLHNKNETSLTDIIYIEIDNNIKTFSVIDKELTCDLFPKIVRYNKNNYLLNKAGSGLFISDGELFEHF